MPAAKSPEFRRRAVELARLGEKPISQIAKDLGIAESGLRRWMKQADIDEGKKDGLTSDERAELVRLRREKRVLEMGSRSSSAHRPTSRGRTCSRNSVPGSPGACRGRCARRDDLPGAERLDLGLLRVALASSQ